MTARGAAASGVSFFRDDTRKSRMLLPHGKLGMHGKKHSADITRGGIEMSGAQMAHLLKQMGQGSEPAGVIAVYHAGWTAGAGQALPGGTAAYGIRRLGESGGFTACEETI